MMRLAVAHPDRMREIGARAREVANDAPLLEEHRARRRGAARGRAQPAVAVRRGPGRPGFLGIANDSAIEIASTPEHDAEREARSARRRAK